MHNHFKKIGPKYYLTDPMGILIEIMDSISLVLHVKANDDVDLVKYGSYPSVLDWFYQHEKDYPTKSGEYLLTFGSKEWPVEELNKLLSDDSYAKIFYGKLKGTQ